MASFCNASDLTKDPSADFSKADAIEDAVRRCTVDKQETIDVGDQPAEMFRRPHTSRRCPLGRG